MSIKITQCIIVLAGAIALALPKALAKAASPAVPVTEQASASIPASAAPHNHPVDSGSVDPLRLAIARPILNQSPETLRSYFGEPTERWTFESETGELLEALTYDPTALRQAVPTLGDRTTFRIIYQNDRAQWIAVSPDGGPSSVYGPESGRQLFEFIFGYGAPVWLELPRPAMGIGGYYEGRACLGDGIRTDWEQAAALISVRLFYDTDCEPPYGTFADIENHWSKDYVEALVERNILRGYPDGTFRPDARVTRAEFAAMAAAAFDPQPRRAAIDFSHVDDHFWAARVITAASAGGYLNGYPDGTFRPQEPVLRQDVYVALAGGLEIAPGDGDLLNEFAGGRSVPNYARAPLTGAIAVRLVVNYPHRHILDVGRPANRADVAAAIYRGLVFLGQADPLPPYRSFIAEFESP
jgi:hypothetical protein